MPQASAGACPAETKTDNELWISETSMEDLYCQEQLQVDSLSPDQGYKTDYSAGMTNWPTVTKVRNTGL